MRTVAALGLAMLCACAPIVVPPSDDGGPDDGGGDSGDAGAQPCHAADASLPADASFSELSGMGQCCKSTADCPLKTTSCVGGRCCLAQGASAPCYANSDCCSNKCSSPSGGTCAP